MVHAFSFCLYGPPKSLYYQGLLENIQLIQQHFPDWVTYVYLGSDVSQSFEDTLRSYASVRIRRTGLSNFDNRMFRYFAIDEDDVELMMVRDADSRIHERDRWAIHDFLNKSTYLVHAIRDHPEHSVPMLAGLWGIRKSAGLYMRKEYEDFKKTPKPCSYGEDQCFLTEKVYNVLFSNILVHVSSKEITYLHENFKVFPFEWSSDLYCGKIEGKYETQPIKKPFSFLRSPMIQLRR